MFKTRKIIFLSSLFFSLHGFSQNFNVQSAADAYKHLQYAKSSYSDLNEAKKFIDLALVNEQTSNDPKMWFYRGLIYLSIDQDTSSAVRNLDADAIEKSGNSFINCIKTDAKKYFAEECNNKTWVAGVRLFNRGVAALNKGETEKASKYFALTSEILPYDKGNNMKQQMITPDIITYNLAKASIKGKDSKKAIVHLQKLIDIKYNDPMIYLYMDRIYLEEKDTAKALAYVDQGRKIFDEHTGLLNEEIRIYSLQGKIDVLISKFDDAININPDLEVLYYNRGTLHENKKDFKKAEADYKKAIELKPEYLDANYGLGTMFFNQAADLIRATNNMKSNEEFDKAKKEYMSMLKMAEPYLEKAMELNPRKSEDEINLFTATLNSLKQLYARTEENTKYEKIKYLLEHKQ